MGACSSSNNVRVVAQSHPLHKAVDGGPWGRVIAVSLAHIFADLDTVRDRRETYTFNELETKLTTKVNKDEQARLKYTRVLNNVYEDIWLSYHLKEKWPEINEKQLLPMRELSISASIGTHLKRRRHSFRVHLRGSSGTHAQRAANDSVEKDVSADFDEETKELIRASRRELTLEDLGEIVNQAMSSMKQLLPGVIDGLCKIIESVVGDDDIAAMEPAQRLRVTKQDYLDVVDYVRHNVTHQTDYLFKKMVQSEAAKGISKDMFVTRFHSTVLAELLDADMVVAHLLRHPPTET